MVTVVRVLANPVCRLNGFLRVAFLGSLAALATAPHVAQAVVFDNTNGNTLWSETTNWAPDGSPAGLNVTFDDTAHTTTGLGAGNVTNIVDASISIGSLTYLNDDGNALTPPGGGLTITRAAQTPRYHTTQINGGTTLTVTDTLTVGQTSLTGNEYIGTRVAVIDGGGSGTLVFDNSAADIRIDPESDFYAHSHTVQLDLSGLSHFSATAASIQVGVAGSTTATLNLAGTNVMNADSIHVGSGGWGTIATLEMGQTNQISADVLSIGGTNLPPQHNGFTATLDFRTGLVNPTVTLRAKDTTSPIGSVSVGLGGNINANTVADLDFRNGSVDALFDNVDIGIGFNQATGTGSLSLDEGSINANTLRLGSSGTGTGVGTGVGNLNVEGGTLTVGVITIADKQGSGNATGNINLSGGTLQASTIQRGAAGGTINFDFDSGKLQNKPGTNLTIGANVPIDILTNGTHTIEADTGRTIAINGAVSGSAARVVEKLGDGTLLLNGNSPYSGTINVNAGTLGGNGSVNGDVNVNSGATLGPGASAGTFSVVGDVVFDTGSVFEVELAGLNPGEFDVLEITGGLTFDGGTINAKLINGSYPNSSFIIATTTEGVTVNGSLEGLIGGGFVLELVNGGNDLLLTVPAPEPSSHSLFILGSVFLRLRRRRRMKR